MGYTVHLKDCEKQVEMTTRIEWDWRRFSEIHEREVCDQYWWQQGSNSCDCSRLSYMYPDNRSHTCNFGLNRVIVTKVVTDAGDIVYEEMEVPYMSLIPVEASR